MSYTQDEYMKKIIQANNKGEKLYIINGDLVIAPIGYYICMENSNVSDGTINPQYPEILRQRKKSLYERKKKSRQREYQRLSDRLILRKLRKQLIGQWTDTDEQNLLSELLGISNEIKKKYPYPDINE